MSLTRKGIGINKSIDRIRGLNQLIRSFRARKLDMRTKLGLVTALVCPMTEYGVHMMESTPVMESAAEHMLFEATRWITNSRGGKILTRARAALQLGKFRGRRWRLAAGLKIRLLRAVEKATSPTEAEKRRNS